MTMQDLKLYVEIKKKRNAEKWQAECGVHGHCKPLTDAEWRKYRDIIFSGKDNYKVKFVHNEMWNFTR